MPLGLLLLGCSLLLLPALGAAPFERAEIYFMDGARSLVERGDLLVPFYRGQPFFDKPALTYWLMAASFRLFGFTPEAARLVPALATLAVLLATVWLGTLLLEERAALVAGFVLATTVAFVSFGRVAMSDMLLALWSTLAVGVAVRGCRPNPPAWLVPALGALLGLGFQTKGPIALVLPGLALLLLLLGRPRGARAPLGAAGLALGLALFAALGLGWFAALYLRLGAAPLVHFFLRENVQRFAGETYDTGREVWFYLPTYLAEGLPWSLFVPVALGSLRSERPGRAGARFLAGWAALMAVPLSLSRGKIDYYLLPLYPALSLVIGHYFASVEWGRVERVWARAALALAAAGVLLLALGPARLPEGWLPGLPARLAFAVLAVSGALACLLAVARPTPTRTAVVLGGTTAALFLALVTLFLPAFRRSQPNRAILEDVARERLFRPDAGVVVCDDPTRVQRDLLFHARVAVTERCDLWNPASSRYPFLLLLQREEQRSLSGFRRIRAVNEYRYLPATALTLRGWLELPEPEPLFLVANYPTRDPVARVRKRMERVRREEAAEQWLRRQQRRRARGGR